MLTTSLACEQYVEMNTDLHLEQLIVKVPQLPVPRIRLYYQHVKKKNINERKKKGINENQTKLSRITSEVKIIG